MNWEAASAVGQVLGSLAVFITLAYLATQVKLARHEMTRAANQSRNEAVREMVAQSRLHIPDYSALHERLHLQLGGEPQPFVTELMKRTGCTHDEAVLVYWDQVAWWQLNMQNLRNRDLMNEGAARGVELAISRIYSARPLSALWYQFNRGTLDPDMVADVDRIIVSAGRADDRWTQRG